MDVRLEHFSWDLHQGPNPRETSISADIKAEYYSRRLGIQIRLTLSEKETGYFTISIPAMGWNDIVSLVGREYGQRIEELLRASLGIFSGEMGGYPPPMEERRSAKE